jgi:hypothetical protein
MENIMPVYDLLPANLLLCLRPGANPDLLAAFDEETWADVLRQARHYNLAPLLYQRLVRERPELTLPPEAAAALRDAYYHTLAENSRRYNTLA